MCRFQDCENKVKSLGLCQAHYVQYRRTGELKPIRIVGDPVKRFWSKVDSSGEHWTWIPGPKDSHGYGQFSVGRQKIYPHRFSYELHYGEIPKNLEIDHICRVKLCVRPEHLRAVTHKVNANNRDDNLLVINGVLHCRRRHAVIGDNKYSRPNGKVECRVCINRRVPKAI